MSGEAQPTRRRLFFREAISLAVREAMTADPNTIVIGQDVGSFGGSYREFDGLFETFGAQRVRDAPVAEAAMVGIGVGAAAAGLRPLVSITYMDFMMLALDPLVNYGAKLRYKTGGQLFAPIVVKTTAGAKGQGVAHSQSIEAWLMSVPGLKVVAPSSPDDAYGLMKLALQETGPVVYVDHKRLFPTPGDVEIGGETLPIGKARVLRSGSDVTITTHSYMTLVALAAAERLHAEGISCEVLDLRTLAPLDRSTIVESVRRTGALVTLEEGQVICGVGAEVMAAVHEELGPTPACRLGALPAPISSNPILEAECIPTAERLSEMIRKLVRETSER